MKIAHLLNGLDIMMSNQEMNFLEKFNNVKINSLNEQELWIAQNLLRKGVYTLSKDSKTLIKNLDENNQ